MCCLMNSLQRCCLFGFSIWQGVKASGSIINLFRAELLTTRIFDRNNNSVILWILTLGEPKAMDVDKFELHMKECRSLAW